MTFFSLIPWFSTRVIHCILIVSVCIVKGIEMKLMLQTNKDDKHSYTKKKKKKRRQHLTRWRDGSNKKKESLFQKKQTLGHRKRKRKQRAKRDYTEEYVMLGFTATYLDPQKPLCFFHVERYFLTMP